jgi:hypothetical protein
MFAYCIRLAWLGMRRNPVLVALIVAAIGVGVGTFMTTYNLYHVASGNPIPQKSERQGPCVDEIGVDLPELRQRRVVGGLGLVVGVVGLAILLYLSALWAFGDQAIGSRPLLLLGVLLVLLAVQLASVGLLAELLISQEAAREDPQRHVIARTMWSQRAQDL